MTSPQRKALIERKLLEAAEDGDVPLTYEQFGERVGIWRMRGARDALDEIAAEWIYREGWTSPTFYAAPQRNTRHKFRASLPNHQPQSRKASLTQRCKKSLTGFVAGARTLTGRLRSLPC